MFGFALFNVYLASLLWQYSSIHNFFRSKRVMLSLTLKERAIHVYRLLLQYASIDNFFRSKRVMLSLTLKKRAMHVYLACLFIDLFYLLNFNYTDLNIQIVDKLTIK